MAGRLLGLWVLPFLAACAVQTSPGSSQTARFQPGILKWEEYLAELEQDAEAIRRHVFYRFLTKARDDAWKECAVLNRKVRQDLIAYWAAPSDKPAVTHSASRAGGLLPQGQLERDYARIRSYVEKTIQDAKRNFPKRAQAAMEAASLRFKREFEQERERMRREFEERRDRIWNEAVTRHKERLEKSPAYRIFRLLANPELRSRIEKVE